MVSLLFLFVSCVFTFVFNTVSCGLYSENIGSYVSLPDDDILFLLFVVCFLLSGLRAFFSERALGLIKLGSVYLVITAGFVADPFVQNHTSLSNSPGPHC